MSYKWKWQGIELDYFSPREFDHPELMDGDFLLDADELRRRCGFPLTVNDDARTQEDLERIYAKEIAKGQSYPTDSAHLFVDGEDAEDGNPIPVRALDLEPSVPRDGDGSELTLDERELDLLYEIGRMRKEGRWPKLGLGIETGHFHVDDTPRLGLRRPNFWVAVSR